MGKRGSETYPIDLTEDESPSKKQKKAKRERATSITEEDFKNLTRRLQFLEERFASSKQEEDSKSKLLIKNEATDEIRVKCQNLENRVEALESCLERLAQVFSFGPNTAAVDPSDRKPNGKFSPENRSHESLDSLTNGLCESAGVQETDATDSVLAESTVIDRNQHMVQNNINIRSLETSNEIVHVEGPLQKQNDADHVTMGHSENLNLPVTEPPRGSDGRRSRTSICSNGRDDYINELISEAEEAEAEDEDEESVDRNGLDQPGDIIPPVIKKEIDLQRDDQGRVLMTLYSSAKKLNKTSSAIVAVAGMYLTDQLHNEFVFESDRSMRDVKLEAELRAALFGLETIKTLFSGSLNQVCVMIISSSQYLVQQMKVGKVYPNFYICSCEHRYCEHSERRWASEETLGKTQISVLPDLMIAIKSLRVHWCKVDQLSPEEQVSVNSYKSGVDAVLEVHMRLKRRERNGTT